MYAHFGGVGTQIRTQKTASCGTVFYSWRGKYFFVLILDNVVEIVYIGNKGFTNVVCNRG